MDTSITIQVTGFVGSDPQTRQVGEQQVASFSVAVSRKNRAGDKQTVWVRVNCWNKLAEWLRPSAWIDQNGTAQPNLDIDANF